MPCKVKILSVEGLDIISGDVPQRISIKGVAEECLGTKSE
jgi:hypothetical protein